MRTSCQYGSPSPSRVPWRERAISGDRRACARVDGRARREGTFRWWRRDLSRGAMAVGGVDLVASKSSPGHAQFRRERRAETDGKFALGVPRTRRRAARPRVRLVRRRARGAEKYRARDRASRWSSRARPQRAKPHALGWPRRRLRGQACHVELSHASWRRRRNRGARASRSRAGGRADRRAGALVEAWRESPPRLPSSPANRSMAGPAGTRGTRG